MISVTYAGGGTSTTNSKMYFNSVGLTGSISGSSGGNVLTLTNEITVGDRQNGSGPFDGMIYEIIFYDRKLDDADR